MGRYQEVFRRSLTDREGFWGEAAKAIEWYREPTVVLDDSNPPFYRWFPGGVLNTCFNALDRHVRNGRGGQPALIYDSPVTGTCRVLTYRQLVEEVARFGGVLRGLGVGAGDRVIIYMPMIPEAVVAMLGCARIGAVHSVVFGGFAAHELAVRIDSDREGAYAHLLSERDQEALRWARAFNPYDLYSKREVEPNLDELRPYYEDLVAEFFPPKIRW